MKTLTAPKIAQELIKWISRVEIPQEILTDQRTNFMSGTLKAICNTLKPRHLLTFVCHSQADVEQFNRTLKEMLRACIQGDPRKWDLLTPLLLFTIWEVPQISMNYFPFELVYGHKLQSIIHVVCEEQVIQEQSRDRTPKHVLEFRGHVYIFIRSPKLFHIKFSTWITATAQ